MNALLNFRFHKDESGEPESKVLATLANKMLCGLILGIFQIVYTYSVASFDGTLLYPMYSGGSLLFSAISSVIFLKESLTHRQKISVLIGCMALICMNL